MGFGRQRLVVKVLGGAVIERELELVAPAEFAAYPSVSEGLECLSTRSAAFLGLFGRAARARIIAA